MPNIDKKLTMKNFSKKCYLYIGNFLRWMKVAWLRKTGVTIGENCFISFGAKFDMSRGKIVVGNNCTITSGTILLSHDPTKRRIIPGASGKGTIIIKDNVFIGVRSIILMNVTLGEGCIIGAGTVVSKDVPPYAVVTGPAQKIIKYRAEE